MGRADLIVCFLAAGSDLLALGLMYYTERWQGEPPLVLTPASPFPEGGGSVISDSPIGSPIGVCIGV